MDGVAASTVNSALNAILRPNREPARGMPSIVLARSSLKLPFRDFAAPADLLVQVITIRSRVKIALDVKGIPKDLPLTVARL